MTEYEGHTPGPWRCHINTTSIHGGQSRVDGFSIVGSEGAFKILICRGADHLGEYQTRANARLIAAAPTLLSERDEARAQRDALAEALQKMETTVSYLMETYLKDETEDRSWAQSDDHWGALNLVVVALDAARAALEKARGI